MLSPIGLKLREKEGQKPAFSIGTPGKDMSSLKGTMVSTPATAKSTPSTTVKAAALKPGGVLKPGSLQSTIDETITFEAEQSKLPSQTQAQALARGGTISAAPEDKSIPLGRKIPFIGPILFGSGINQTYTPGTMAGSIEKLGAIGFFTEGFQRIANPSREQVGERIFERYSKFTEEGIDDDRALEAAIQDTANKTLGTAVNTRDLQLQPITELTEDEEALLFWINAKEKLFATLDAPIFVGSTKAVTKGLESEALDDFIAPIRDEILNRLKSPVPSSLPNQRPGSFQRADILDDDNEEIQSYIKALENNPTPSISQLNDGLELLRVSGRQVDDLSEQTLEATRTVLNEPAKYIRDSTTGQFRGSTPATIKEPVALKPITGTPDAMLRTKAEVPMKDLSGTKFSVPAGTVIEPRIDGAKTYITVDGTEYAINKNQYDNLKGQSIRATAQPFAPELADTVETVRGVVSGDPKAKALKTIEDNGYMVEEDMMDMYITKNDEIVDYDELPDNVRQAVDTYFGDAETKYDVDSGLATKYSKYTLPGGDNYREILIQAPTRDNSPYVLTKTGNNEVLGEYPNLEEARKALTRDYGVGYGIEPKGGPTKDYKSSHWDEPNVIAHVRANERVVDGEKHFFLEEIQSDWARDGRSKGFAGSQAEIDALVKKSDELVTKYPVSNRTRNQQAEIDIIGDQINKLTDAQDRGVPNNPLLKDWQVTAVKRALIEADKSGADRFTWINGAQTSERYKLSTHVEDVAWRNVANKKHIKLKPKSGTDIFFDVNEKGEIQRGIAQGVPNDWYGKKLDEVLGKGLADSIMAKETGTLSGEGLEFGGEWAKNLYDKQVRDIVKKLTGAEIEEVDLGVGLGKQDAFTLNDGNDAGGFVYPRNLKVGLDISDAKGVGYIVTEIGENGKFKAIQKSSLDEDQKGFGLPRFISNLKSGQPSAIMTAKRSQKDFDIGPKSQTQQSIRLTPEVKAKINGKAPELKGDYGGAYAGMPLIFNAFDTQTAETAVEASTGLPEGYEEDAEGNITIDPKKAFLGMAAAGFLGVNFNRAKGPIQNKLDAQGAASGRPDQRVLPTETSLPKAGQTQYPLSSPVFSDSLAKSYASNVGQSIDETLATIPHGTVDVNKAPEYSRFRKGIEEAWTFTVEVIQDNMIRMRKLVNDPNVKITDDSDPYMAELLFHGRVGAKLTEARDFVKTVDADLIKTAKNNGIPDSDLTLLVNKFLHATHAPERNGRLGDGAAGMTTADAQSILRDIDALPYADEVKRIARNVQMLNTKTLDILLEAQVLDKEAYDSMRTAYANHVPLQRVLTEDEDMIQVLTSSGFDVKSTGIKRAKGSERQVADIIANIVTNYEQAVIRAEKNLVDLATLQFARNNKELGLFEEVKPKVIGRRFDVPSKPSIDAIDEAAIPMPPAMEQPVNTLRTSIEDAWADVYNEMLSSQAGVRGANVYTDDSGIIEKITSTRSTFPSWIPEDSGLRDMALFNKVLDMHQAGKTPRANATREFALLDLMESRLLSKLPLEAQDELALSYLARESETLASVYVKVKAARGTPIYEQLTDPRILTLRENGVPVNLLIKDEKLAIALKGVNKQHLPQLMKFVGVFTRFYSGLQTRFNPEFAFPNKLRDLQEAVVYASSRSELGFRGGIKGALDQRAYLDVLDGIRGKDSEGARLYNQMIADGGTTGGIALSTREAVELDIAAIRKMNRSNPRAAADMLIRGIDNFNQIFEDSTRLALYKEALNRGVSRKRAAVIAKEASVNFNKFGTGGPILNSLWMFSNASIQGTTKLVRAMSNPKTAAIVTGSIGTAVYATGEWNDRIDPEWRKKVTQWDRNNALIVVLPAGEEGDKFDYIAIPVGYGIKPIKVMMDYAYDAATGNAKSAVETMNGIGSAIINSYNPLGGTDLFSSVTPTLMDIPAEIARNKAWHGGKIMPDWDQNAPDSIRYFSTLDDNTTGKIAVQVSEGLSGAGIEVSPASLYYAYQGYVGGAGRTATDFVNTMITLGSGELPESNDIPVWSRFIKQRDNEEIGAASEEYEAIKSRLAEQSRERFYVKQDAENSYRQLATMDTEKAAALFDEIAAKDPELAEAIVNVKADEDAGITYTQRLIKQLGVDNGERAAFIYEKLQGLETDEERAALWEEYTEKKIITKSVAEQLTELLNQ